MIVRLTYFTPGGAFYAVDEYTTSVASVPIELPSGPAGPRGAHVPPLIEIWKEVEHMTHTEALPGIPANLSRFFTILIDVPGHPFSCPHLLPTVSEPHTTLPLSPLAGHVFSSPPGGARSQERRARRSPVRPTISDETRATLVALQEQFRRDPSQGRSCFARAIADALRVLDGAGIHVYETATRSDLWFLRDHPAATLRSDLARALTLAEGHAIVALLVAADAALADAWERSGATISPEHRQDLADYAQASRRDGAGRSAESVEAALAFTDHGAPLPVSHHDRLIRRRDRLHRPSVVALLSAVDRRYRSTSVVRSTETARVAHNPPCLSADQRARLDGFVRKWATGPLSLHDALIAGLDALPSGVAISADDRTILESLTGGWFVGADDVRALLRVLDARIPDPVPPIESDVAQDAHRSLLRVLARWAAQHSFDDDRDPALDTIDQQLARAVGRFVAFSGDDVWTPSESACDVCEAVDHGNATCWSCVAHWHWMPVQDRRDFVARLIPHPPGRPCGPADVQAFVARLAPPDDSPETNRAIPLTNSVMLSSEQRMLLDYYRLACPRELNGLQIAISSGLRSLGSGYPPPTDDLAALRGCGDRLAGFLEIEAAVAALVRAIETETAARSAATGTP